MSEQTLPRSTLVLVHGAWAGSWIWRSLMPLLEDAGITVIAPDMPGTPAHPAPPEQLNLQGCLEHVLTCCKSSEGPLFLLGHSGGGVIATQTAQALGDRVSGVIYVAGMMLPSGCGFADVIAELIADVPTAAGIGPHLLWSDDRQFSRVPPEAGRAIFLHDVPEKVAQAAALRLCPQPEGTRAMVPCWTAERFGRVPRLYVEALEDCSVVLAAQRRMQELVPGAEVVSLNTGHVPQVAAPKALAEAILSFMARHSAGAFTHQPRPALPAGQDTA